MKSVEHSKTFTVPQPVSRVFPLFSPEGEKHWVPGWDYENVMGTKELSEDDVFLTKSHDHAAAEAVWLVKRYRPAAHCVEFYKVEPGGKVGVVKVCCEAWSVSTHRLRSPTGILRSLGQEKPLFRDSLLRHMRNSSQSGNGSCQIILPQMADPGRQPFAKERKCATWKRKNMGISW